MEENDLKTPEVSEKTHRSLSPPTIASGHTDVLLVILSDFIERKCSPTQNL